LLRYKLPFILSAAPLISQFLSCALTPLLMVGGTYLCYEAVAKMWKRVEGHGETAADAAHEQGMSPTKSEITGSAIRTDFIPSAEIMVISLNEVADEPFLSRAVILVIVAFATTLLVYRVVALLVKMGDVGLHLSESSSGSVEPSATGLSVLGHSCSRPSRPSASPP